MNRDSLALLLPLTLALLLTGCDSIEKRKESLVLESTLSAYETTIRWGNLSNAYQYLDSDEAASAPRPSHLENVRVLSYEIVSPPVRTDEVTANQTVRIHYLYVDSQAVKNITDHQVWGYNAEEKLWRLKTGVPEFP